MPYNGPLDSGANGEAVSESVLSEMQRVAEQTIRDRLATPKMADVLANAPTLRDQFATAALGGITGNPECVGHIHPIPFQLNELTDEDAATLAKFVYRIADAMLRARKEQA